MPKVGMFHFHFFGIPQQTECFDYLLGDLDKLKKEMVYIQAYMPKDVDPDVKKAMYDFINDVWDSKYSLVFT